MYPSNMQVLHNTLSFICYGGGAFIVLAIIYKLFLAPCAPQETPEEKAKREAEEKKQVEAKKEAEKKPKKKKDDGIDSTFYSINALNGNLNGSMDDWFPK